MSDFSIRRVVIACDAVNENRRAIEAAARLAARWDAALHGIFVEDRGLLQVAALPFSREVSLAARRVEEFSAATVEEHFIALAARTRVELENAARGRGIRPSFSVVRDSPSPNMAPIEEADLLIVESASRPFAGQLRLASQWLAIACETHRSVLLIRGGVARRGVRVLVQAAGAETRRVVAAAARFAGDDHGPLTLILATSAVAAAEAQGWVREVAPGLAAQCRVEIVASDQAALGRAVMGHADEILVIDAGSGVNDVAALKALAAQTAADVLLVR